MFFFFKQKTAYEMRISDWSSDVCSSDLIGASAALAQRGIGGSEIAEPRRFLEADIVGKDDDRIGRRDHIFTQAAEWILVKHRLRGGREPEIALQDKGGAGHRIALATGPAGAATRSEEHTSELQSLMRISYAVFCLKKKKKITKTIYIISD